MTKQSKHDLLMRVMYAMFKDGTLPHIDMEDYECMWKALIDKWEIDILDETFAKFIEDVNCKASDNYSYFSMVFRIYFNN